MTLIVITIPILATTGVAMLAYRLLAYAFAIRSSTYQGVTLPVYLGIAGSGLLLAASATASIFTHSSSRA